MKKITPFFVVASALLLNVSYAWAADVTVAISQPPIVKITSFSKLLGSIVGVALIVAAIAAFFFLIWGGVQWITSGGDKAGVEAAQHRIQAALVGLLIVFAAWALFSVVGSFLGFSITDLTLPSPTGN